ncbi:dimethylarginine dimethylaminohydrolase [Plantibacter sp. Leaf171]|uniref:dimethylargininase n=1 Tax=unclassified Plantibacter TaxID=2624265 RepID=UPI0006FB9B7B|nr:MULTISPECIES: dimethylargininase [unclassified Plantibacter]KQM15802.1 dimethylarginine dimethylaminohydrolase [Plantibacter sp. Leaf1]KQR58945.1 dimethylarginine dimethylaminohydrolase [Plantibacter sp. Leaf171]
MTATWSRKLIASAAAAVATIVVGFLGVMFVTFVGYQFAGTIFAQASPYFFESTIITFVLLLIVGVVGLYRFRLLALLGGAALAVIGALLGLIVQVATTGQPVNSTVLGSIVATLISLNLVFVVVIALSAAFIGYPVYRMVIRTQDAVLDEGRRIALVRMPASNLAEGLVTHQERATIDTELADQQWDAYVAALDAAGWDTTEVSWADQLADSVFIEDTVVVVGDLAIVTRPGAESRRPEIVAAETTARELGLRIHRIEGDGTLEGGDVLQVGTTVYVGRSGRTNAEGVRQLRNILAPSGFDVVAVPVTKALHLKSTVTALPDGTVLVHPDLVDDPSFFGRHLVVPEREGVAVVELADDTVLISAAAPKTAALLEDRGYTVVQVDISEFEKLEGCVTCLSVRVS